MSATHKSHIVILTTTTSAEQAGELAAALVDRRLAACVNIVGPVKSIYRWEGKLSRDEEHLLVIKTADRLFEETRAAIEELHTYDVPEVIALPIHGGSEPYLRWLAGSLRD